MIHQAVQAFQSGNLQSAETILKRVLQVHPKTLPALHILGLINASQSKHKEAAELLKKASLLNPSDPSIHYNLAKALQESGSNKESIPHHKKAAELSPDNPEIWLNYGKSLALLKHFDDALNAFKKALKIQPDYTEALLNLGMILNGLKRYEDALIEFDKAISINVNFHEAWYQKGVTLNGLARHLEALQSYEQAVIIQPSYHEAWYKLGFCLSILQRHKEALTAHDRAISLKPDYHEAWFNKGAIYKEFSLYEEALASCNQAIHIKPDYVDPWCWKGQILKQLHRYEEALAAYEQAIALDPDFDYLLAYQIHTKLLIADWSGIEPKVNLLIKKIAANKNADLPISNFSIIDSEQILLESAKMWGANNNPVRDDLPPISKKTHNKIRIGYFSADLKTHPVGLLTVELFESHNREKFEIIAFSLKPAKPNDEVHQRLKSAFDQFISVDDKSDIEIAKLARELEIDIAIDLGGYTESARSNIFSYRCAPVQVNYLGFPGTMGSECIDYIIGDQTVIPETSKPYFQEKVVYLPNSYMIDDSSRKPSSAEFKRADFNLPENRVVFCCFNNSYKFNKKTISSWARIMLQVDGSVLWISKNNSSFQKNILKEFSNLNIDEDRIIFADRLDSLGDHLARYRLADLFLDTVPFNAHTTAIDALKSGVPVLTLLRRSFAGRVGGSLLKVVLI